jgi:hypothetical protein
MSRYYIKCAIIILLTFSVISGSVLAEEIDFISILEQSPEKVKSLGLQKLNKEERASINVLLNQVYQLGLKTQNQSTNQHQGSVGSSEVVEKKIAGIPVYITKIDDCTDDVLKLENGAIVETKSGYLGFVGFRKRAVLYKDARGWKIWIDGKKSFNCDVLKSPQYQTAKSGEKVSIVEVKGDGKYLVTSSGSLLEVNQVNTIETSFWIGYFEAIVIDGSQLINLENGGEIIDVTKIR